MEMDSFNAYFIFWTELWHLCALIFSLYVNGLMIRKAEHSPQRTSYIIVQSCVLLWIISKILKTVAPNVDLRWLFIVTQYLGISFLGSSFFLFTYTTVKRKIPGKWVLFLLVLFSTICFVLAATNPLHFQFYSYFDFYWDSFGPLFYLTMLYQYGLMLISLVMISWKIIVEKESSKAERFIGIAALIPFGVNILYIVDVINPLFDVTPIAMTLVLSLFALASFKYRFLGVINLADETIRKGVHDPVVIRDKKGRVVAGPRVFKNQTVNPGETVELRTLFFRLESRRRKRRYFLEHWVDVSPIKKMEQELLNACDRLEGLSQQILEGQELLLERAHNEAVRRAQFDLHDILGHSMTQILLLLRSAMVEGAGTPEVQVLNAGRALALCERCLADIHSAVDYKGNDVEELLSSSIFKMEEDFVKDKIDFCISIKGIEVPLNGELHRNLIFCCREAITNALRHGKASSIDIIARFLPDSFSLHIADNGKGCDDIKPGMGLKGMSKRVHNAGGQIRWQSETGEGTLLVIKFPTPASYKTL